MLVMGIYYDACDARAPIAQVKAMVQMSRMAIGHIIRRRPQITINNSNITALERYSLHTLPLPHITHRRPLAAAGAEKNTTAFRGPDCQRAVSDATAARSWQGPPYLPIHFTLAEKRAKKSSAPVSSA